MKVSNNVNMPITYSQRPKTDAVDVNGNSQTIDPARAKDCKLVRFDSYNGVPIIGDVNSTEIVAGPTEDGKLSYEQLFNIKSVRCDRYEGTTVHTATFDLTAPNTEVSFRRTRAQMSGRGS